MSRTLSKDEAISFCVTNQVIWASEHKRISYMGKHVRKIKWPFVFFKTTLLTVISQTTGGRGSYRNIFKILTSKTKKIYTKNLGTPILCNKRHRKQTFHTSQNIFKKLLLSNIDYSDIFLELHWKQINNQWKKLIQKPKPGTLPMPWRSLETLYKKKFPFFCTCMISRPVN